ncbi:hypothetical protein I0K15_13220 [Pontivivens ytuae]|uniref:Uncharacterized protein n=2 Tax=Pontivivens ytuae TaxID=2789856 RepID=A0A7S9LPA5_9RHOB|nr:hypothetical protein I0K15_13220 [Pontivivens ytuae]
MYDVLIASDDSDDLRERMAACQRAGLNCAGTRGMIETRNALLTGYARAFVLPLTMRLATALADLAVLRNPRVVIVPLADASVPNAQCVYDIVPNARTMLNTRVAPEDLAAVLCHVIETEAPMRETA